MDTDDAPTAARAYAMAKVGEVEAHRLYTLREAFLAGAAWHSQQTVGLLAGIVRQRDREPGEKVTA